MQRILESRVGKKGTFEYLVKWEGYATSENTWEPAANLVHCGQKLDKFNKSQQSEPSTSAQTKSKAKGKGKGKGKGKSSK